jgi:hypothetical protein
VWTNVLQVIVKTGPILCPIWVESAMVSTFLIIWQVLGRITALTSGYSVNGS